MNTHRLIGIAAALCAAFASPALAQQQDFPSARERPASCDAFDWSNEMLREHPRIDEACQEVVMAEGSSWARLSAKFVKVQGDGLVIFDLFDSRDRYLEQVSMQPTAGQVAYINDRATDFENLRKSDTINLYAPEGRYGFASRAGAAPDQIARVVRVPIEALAAPTSTSTMVAMNDDPPLRTLPRTAGILPLTLVSGCLALILAATLMLRRQR